MKWVVTFSDPQGKPWRQVVEADTREQASDMVKKDKPWAYDVEAKKDLKGTI